MVPNLIEQNSLIEFSKLNLNFAECAYDCDASEFVEEEVVTDPVTYKSNHIYRFKSFYLDHMNFSEYPLYPYQVLFIKNKAYLMYEISEIIFIWVCYSEPNYRNRGLMSLLIKHLKSIYPNKQIQIDTFNKSLQKISKAAGIKLFRD